MNIRRLTLAAAAKKAIKLALLACLMTALSIVLPAPLPARTLKVPAPKTTGRTVAIHLAGLVPPGRAKGVRIEKDGAVTALQAQTLASTAACPGVPFTAMALVWDQPGQSGMSARVEVGQSTLQMEQSAVLLDEGDEGPDEGTPEDHPGRHASSLFWVGSARCSKLTVSLAAGARIKNLRAVYVNSAGKSPAEIETPEAKASILGPAPAGAATMEPAIVTRQQWGANEKLRNCGPYYLAPVKMAFVHHTAGQNDYTRSQSDDVVRAIYWYHTQSLGWCDIAYSFLVDRFGRVYEGRYGGMDQPVLPGATKGFNTGSFAVSALGTYGTVAPSSAMVAAIERLLAWRMDVAHVPPTGQVWMLSRGSTGDKYPVGKWVRFNRVSGHRDAGFTSCPGNLLYAKLPAIRNVAYDTGLPKIFLPKQSASSIVAAVDQTTWSASGSRWMWWRVEVSDQSGHVIRTFKRRGTAISVDWTGLDAFGQPAPIGTYTVMIFASKGGSALPASLMLDVVPEPIPTPSPFPTDSPSPSPSP